MKLIQDNRFVPRFVRLGEGDEHVALELSFRHLVVSLDHDRDLDQTCRGKTEVAVDCKRLARIQILDRNADRPRESPDDLFQALLDRRGAAGGHARCKSQESGKRPGRSKERRESHEGMLMDTIFPTRSAGELRPREHRA